MATRFTLRNTVNVLG